MSNQPDPVGDRPLIGETVHYVARGSADGRFPSVCRAALVTELPNIVMPQGAPHADAIRASLAVVNPTGLFFDQALPYVDPKPALEGGTWHWPGDCR